MSAPSQQEPSHTPDAELDIEEICELFVAQIREGQAPEVEEFADRYPTLTEELLETLPAVEMLEQARQNNLRRRKDGSIVRGHEIIDALGDYRILKELGRGGMGIVYEAYQASLDRVVALKVLPRQSASPDTIRRFTEEAAIVARLHHSNIVPVFTVGQENGIVYYSMERLEGRPLDRFVRSGRFWESQEAPPEQLPLDQIVQIGIQIADALHYAHEHGVLHRDVKPANLFLADDRRIWLTDFGLARHQDRPRHPGQAAGMSGTLRYVAPERLRGDMDTAASDQYSLAVSLLELATGQPAFASGQPTELRQQIQANELRGLEKRQRSLPVDLRCILARAAALSPDQRYPSCGDFRDDLFRFSRQQPVSANPLNRWQRARRWYQRNPALAASSGLAIVLLAAIALISTSSYVRVQTLLEAEQRQRNKTRNAARVARRAIDEVFHQLRDGWLLEGSVGPRQQQIERNFQTRDLLNQLASFYEQAARLDDDRPGETDGTISARQQVGRLQRMRGNYQDAIQSNLAALRRLRQVAATAPESEQIQYALLEASILNQIGAIKRIASPAASDIAEHDEALDRLQDELRQAPDHPQVLFEIARTRYLIAQRTRPGMGPASFPPDPESTLDFGGVSAAQELQLNQAIAYLTESLASSKKSEQPATDSDPTGLQLAPDEDLAQRLRLLAWCYRERADDRWSRRDDFDWEDHRSALELQERLLVSHPDNASYQYDLIRTLAEINVFDRDLTTDQLRHASLELERAVSLGGTLLRGQPSEAAFQIEVAHANYKRAQVLDRLIQLQAITDLRSANEQREASLTRAHQLLERMSRLFPDSAAFQVWSAKFALELAHSLEESQAERRQALISGALQQLRSLSEEDQQRPAVQPLFQLAQRLSLSALIESGASE